MILRSTAEKGLLTNAPIVLLGAEETMEYNYWRVTGVEFLISSVRQA